MKPHLTILLLLLIVVVDSTGDAFRHGAPVLAHSLETLQIAGWFGFAVLFAVNTPKGSIVRNLLFYLVMYVLGRIWLFDITFNLWCGSEIFYMGTKDLVGISVRWFADLVRTNYIHFSFMLKFLSFVTWSGFLADTIINKR